MKFFVSDSINGWTLLQEIDSQTYGKLKNYHADFLKFTNVYDCFKNYKKSEVNLISYFDSLDDDGSSLETIYNECRFLLMTNVFFGRIFVDNVKSLSTQLGIKELRAEIDSLEAKEELKMMKLIRDFGQHFSLPFTNLRHSMSFSRNTSEVEIYISKKELKRNKGMREASRRFLELVTYEEIPLLEYFTKWNIILDKLIAICKDYFLKYTTPDIIKSFETHFRVIIRDRPYFPSGICVSENEVISADAVEHYHSCIESIRYNRLTVEYLFDEVKKSFID